MLTPTVKDIGQVEKRPDKLLTIKEDITVAQAAKKMSDNQVGCLLVFDTQDKFVGVVTERDMLAKVLTTSLAQDKVPVRDIMTPKPISCTMDTTIAKVEQLMSEHRIRHVPVVEDGVPIAMVSSRDIIAYQLRSNKAMKAAAEQLAMLSTGLRSLDFDDVIALAINQVPQSFQADRAVLCFAQKGSDAAMIYRKDCPVPEQKLLKPARIKKLSRNGQIIRDKICELCEDSNRQPPGLIMPLTICEQAGNRGNRNVDRQGFLCMCRFNPSDIDSEKLQLYKASLLQEVLNVNLTNAKLYQNYWKARRDSQTDPLTDVGSRRALEQMLKAEHARAVRYNNCFSVAIVDLDNFKGINDNAGHAAGDKALCQLAKIMNQSIRETDVVARYGGDEFVLLMPETKLNEAIVLSERLRRQVESLSIPGVQPVTISCGIAEWAGCAEDTPERILKRADAALYEAKHKGRNQVAASQPAANTI